MSWRCHDTDVAAPWQSCGNVKAVPWQCCSIAMAALQHCHGSTSMAVRTLLNSTRGPSSQHYTVTPLHHFVHGVPSHHYILHYFENGGLSHHRTITSTPLREQRSIRIDFNDLACLWDAICYTFWNMGMPRPCFGRSWCHCVAPGCIKGQMTELCPHPGRPFAV